KVEKFLRAYSSFRPRFPLSLSGGQRKRDDRKTVAFDFVNADPVASAPANEYGASRHSRFGPELQGGQRPDSKRDDQGRHQVDHSSIRWRPFSFLSRKNSGKTSLAFKFSPGFYAYVSGGARRDREVDLYSTAKCATRGGRPQPRVCRRQSSLAICPAARF